LLVPVSCSGWQEPDSRTGIRFPPEFRGMQKIRQNISGLSKTGIGTGTGIPVNSGLDSGFTSVIAYEHISRYRNTNIAIERVENDPEIPHLVSVDSNIILVYSTIHCTLANHA